MTQNPPQTSEHMISRARRLRRDSTVPEQRLWAMLRGRRCRGLKFRRQQPMGPYVADFFCAAERLVIELDGRSHEGQEILDAQRQEYLERQGLKVIRFTNDAVIADVEGVVEAIGKACGHPGPPSPGPSGRPLPQGER